MPKHWTQTPEGRARMREIALKTNNVTKARLARANSEVKEVKVTALSVYGWEILLTDNEIKIRKQS